MELPSNYYIHNSEPFTLIGKYEVVEPGDLLVHKTTYVPIEVVKETLPELYNWYISLLDSSDYLHYRHAPQAYEFRRDKYGDNEPDGID